VEQGYWWHVAKRELITSLLLEHVPPPAHLVEGGIGAGGNLLSWQDQGYQVTGFDLMSEAVERCRQHGVGDVHRHDLQEPWPIEAATVDVVVMLDVLEHTADPVAVLQNAARVIKPAGKIMVTVPAYPWLMGPWDRMLGHYRRYTAKMLRCQAEEAGLNVVWQSHWNSFTLPAALAVRSAEKVLARKRSAEFPAVGPRVNALLESCARGERRWLRTGRVPFGLSLVGVLGP
jgi:SAM-dependent methyltransferase